LFRCAFEVPGSLCRNYAARGFLALRLRPSPPPSPLPALLTKLLALGVGHVEDDRPLAGVRELEAHEIDSGITCPFVRYVIGVSARSAVRQTTQRGSDQATLIDIESRRSSARSVSATHPDLALRCSACQG
jgi:hypothetical protein